MGFLLPNIANALKVLVQNTKDCLCCLPTPVENKYGDEKNTGSLDPPRNSRCQMARISAAVFGIELCYAAETSFVSPILLKLGVPHALMTMVWCVSPLVGFCFIPVLGSLSDRCTLKLGRRRPFIILLSLGVILGLFLIPNGRILGEYLGDASIHHNFSLRMENNASATPSNGTSNMNSNLFHISNNRFWGIILTIVGLVLLDFNCDASQAPCRTYMLDVSAVEDHSSGLSMFTIMAGIGGTLGFILCGIDWDRTWLGIALGGHVRVVYTLVLIVFVICGVSTVTSFRETPLAELRASTESLKTEKEKEKKKVKKSSRKRESRSTDENALTKDRKNGHIKYGAVAELKPTHIIDGFYTDKSGAQKKESINNDAILEDARKFSTHIHTVHKNAASEELYGSKTTFSRRSTDVIDHAVKASAVFIDKKQDIDEDNPSNETGDSFYEEVSEISVDSPPEPSDATLGTYLRSAVDMPRCMKLLCLTQLLSCMAIVSYALFFTDFVGQSVYGGSPLSAKGSEARSLYDAGVRLGSTGMAFYSMTCAIYSMVLDRFVNKFGARAIYVCSQLTYCIGMTALAILRTPWAVILFSPCAGIQYAIIFYMPYQLISRYHSKELFSQNETSKPQIRGLGTDLALMTSMAFLSQFLLSSCMGTLVSAVGSPVVVIMASAVLSACGAFAATLLTYLDL